MSRGVVSHTGTVANGIITALPVSVQRNMSPGRGQSLWMWPAESEQSDTLAETHSVAWWEVCTGRGLEQLGGGREPVARGSSCRVAFAGACSICPDSRGPQAMEPPECSLDSHPAQRGER